jgi:hypothetical protein
MPVAFRTLITADYLRASAEGALTADATAIDTEAVFALHDLDGGSLEDGDAVQLAASTGAFLTAAGGGGTTIDATAAEAGDAETFTLVRLAGAGPIETGDRVALGTHDALHYVSAIDGGGGTVRADAPWARGWETFVVDRIGEPDPTPDANAAKARVLDYFAALSGAHTLAGVENKLNTAPHGHTDQVAGHAGRTPSFWGIDFGFGDEAIENRDAIVEEAKRQWEAGAVVAFMYHTCVPTRDERCGWDDIGGAHPQHLTSEEWAALFTPGTSIHDEWIRRLDILAGYFATLRDAGVAPLFRPFHEMNQCAFWWSCTTGENGTVRLYQLTHDYLVEEKGLDNIVWVWNVQDFESLAEDVVTYDPGPSYFDIATLDVYNTGYTQGNYEAMLGAAGGKPIGVGECQFLPSLDVLDAQPEWTFFMLWPDFIELESNLDRYPALFGSDRVITLDEMPGWN